MKGFNGFPQKGRLTRVPGLFFSELLPQIDSLAELKVTLYCFWRLQQKEENVPYLTRRGIEADDIFMRGLGSHEDERHSLLLDALERAVARGTLLHAEVQREKRQDDLYFVNTARGRAAVAGIENGQWTPQPDTVPPFDLTVERPNVFTLYEQNIGPLTPHIADNLRDFEQTYPGEWIEEAIRIAVEYNKRSLSYIAAILNRWETEGRIEREEDPSDTRRYISGKYQDDIEY